MHINRLLILIFCFIQLSLLAQDEIPENLREAQAAIESENYDRALNLVENEIDKNADDLYALEMKLNIFYRTERQKEAAKFVDALCFKYPNKPEYLYLNGVNYMLREKYPRAIREFEAALEKGLAEQYFTKLYFNRGLANMRLAEYELAEADFNLVLEEDPKKASAYHSLGMLKYSQNNYQEASENFLKAIQYNDNSSVVYFNLAMTYYRLEELDNACFYFNKSCSLGHRNACRLLLMECAEEIRVPQ